MIITLNLAIYRTKNKKGEKMLIGMNQIMGAKNHFKNYIKQQYQDMVVEEAKRTNQPIISGKYEAIFILHYPHARMDKSNVCAMVDKYAIDALVEAGYLPNDNVNNYKKAVYIVGDNDKENPRCEVIITQVGA